MKNNKYGFYQISGNVEKTKKHIYVGENMDGYKLINNEWVDIKIALLENSPFKEVWLHEGNKERYLENCENIRNGIKQSRSRAKK